jgi:hypothetical protein
MNKYAIYYEHWRIGYAADPTKENFFDYALDNPNGADSSEQLRIFDSKEEALAELKKYKCSYERWDNYNETTFDLYSVEEIIYDEDGDLYGYNTLKYADIE